MKRTTLTVPDILKQMTSSEHLPVRADRHGNDLPTPDQERLDTHRDLVEFANEHPQSIRTCCAGCGQDVEFLKTALCACGGMVCEACQATEEDGVCQHNMPSLEEALDVAKQAYAVAVSEQATVTRRWEEFRAQMLSGLSERELSIIRTTFFSGAFAAVGIVRQAVGVDDYQEWIRRMDALFHEMRVWYESENEDGTVQ